METTQITKEQVMEALKPIQDPELNIGIVDLGLIYNVDIQNDGKKVLVNMTLTSPGCPVGPQLMAMVHAKSSQLSGVEEAEVKLVWTPKWDPKIMASEEAKDQLGIF